MISSNELTFNRPMKLFMDEQKLTFSVVDIVNIKSVQFYENGKKILDTKPNKKGFTYKIPVGANGTYKIVATNVEGKSTTKTFKISNFDSKAPIGKATVKNNTITVKASDDMGIASISYNGQVKKVNKLKSTTVTFNKQKGISAVVITDVVGRKTIVNVK